MRTQLKDMFFNNQKLTAFFYTYIERLLYLHGEFQSTKNKIKKKRAEHNEADFSRLFSSHL